MACSGLAMQQVCFYDYSVFGYLSFEEHCVVVYDALKSFCGQNSLQLHLVNLTRQLLGFGKSSEYPVGYLDVMITFCFWWWLIFVLPTPRKIGFCLAQALHHFAEELVQGCWHSIHSPVFGTYTSRQTWHLYGWRHQEVVRVVSRGYIISQQIHEDFVQCWILALIFRTTGPYFSWPQTAQCFQFLRRPVLLGRPNAVQTAT